MHRRTLVTGLAGLGASLAVPALGQAIRPQKDPYAQVDPYANEGGGGGGGAGHRSGGGATASPFRSGPRWTAEQEAEEIAIGRASHAYWINKGGGPHPDQRLQAAIRELFLPMTRFAQRSHLPWEVVLVNDPEPNASAGPGGKVIVNVGILPICDRAGELAATLAHEIGHVDLGHVRHDDDDAFEEVLALLERQGIDPRMEQTLEAFVPDFEKLGVGEFFRLAYNRDQETAADEHAFYIFDRMGIDPIHIVNDQKNFDLLAGGRTQIEYLRTHPVTDFRVANVERIFKSRKRPAHDYAFKGWDVLKAAYPTAAPWRKG